MPTRDEIMNSPGADGNVYGSYRQQAARPASPAMEEPAEDLDRELSAGEYRQTKT